MRNISPKFLVAAALLAALAGLFFAASQNAGATFWLSRIGVDPYTAAMWLAAGAVSALLLAVSPSLRVGAARAVTASKAFLKVNTDSTKELPPATWPVLAVCRMFLALVVAVHHTAMFSVVHTGTFLWWIYSLDGDKAVLLFFFISGFSIAHSVKTKPEGFYRRRLFRILPVYWACLALAFAAFLIAPEQVAIAKGHYLHCPTSPFAWALQSLPLYGLTSVRVWPYFPAWSVGVEMLFYAFAPLFMRLSVRTLIGLTVISLYFYLNGAGNAFPALWEWLIGLLFYRASGKLWAYALPFLPWAMMVHYDKWNLPHGVWMCFAFGAVIVSLQWIKALPPVLAKAGLVAGDLSYPLYLVHAPMLWMLWLIFHMTNPWAYLPAIAVATVIVYKVVDLPCRSVAKNLYNPHLDIKYWFIRPRLVEVKTALK